MLLIDRLDALLFLASCFFWLGIFLFFVGVYFGFEWNDKAPMWTSFGFSFMLLIASFFFVYALFQIGASV